jgi:hypothetical protein
MYVDLNPSNLVAWDYMARGRAFLADADVERGRIASGLAQWTQAVAIKDDPRLPASLLPQLGEVLAQTALLQADVGQDRSAEATMQLRRQSTAESLRDVPAADPVHVLWPGFDEGVQAELDLLQGRKQTAHDRATAALQRARALPADGTRSIMRQAQIRVLLRTATRAALRLGDYAAAEAYARERSTLPPLQRRPEDPQDAVSANRVMLAHALVGQARRAEAQALLEPDLARYRAERQAGASGLTYVGDYVYALYVDALASDPPRRAQRLDEARSLLATLSPEARQLRNVRALQAWLDAAA